MSARAIQAVPAVRPRVSWMVLAPLATALAALAVRLHVGPLTIDDAYITFRYARNVAEGTGFVYNPGQAVLGTTTPLYTLLMATCYRLGITELPMAAWVVNAALDAATAGLLFLLGRRLVDSTTGVLAGLLFALAPMSIAFSAGGMEGSLFVCLLVGGFWATVNGRSRLALFLIGLATLVRPEAVLAAGPVLAWQLLRTRRLPLAEGLVYAATVAPWAIFATLYFGSPIPQSVAAKSVVYSVAYRTEPFINAIALATQASLPGQSLFVLNTPNVPLLIAVVLVAMPIVVLLGLLGARRLVRADPAALPWVAFPLLYALAYAVAGLRGVRMFHWYVVPLLPFYTLLLAAGVRTVTEQLRVRHLPAVRWVPIALLVLWWIPGLLSPEHVGYPVGFTDARERLYRQVALDYRDAWGPDTLIAVPEIGALGYYAPAEILDTVGLVSPIAVSYYPIPGGQLLADNAVPPTLIRDVRPDYVVTLDQFVLGALVPDPWFQEHYQLVERRDIALWDSKELLVYRRSDLGTRG